MFCEKCGKELKEGSLFCEKCGSRVKSNNTFENILVDNSKRKKKKKTIIIITAIFVILSGIFLAAGSESNEYVQAVKTGQFNDYPDIQIGDAFEKFFGEPKWRHFVSDANVDIVEFTGTCTYDDEPVKVLIQFKVNDDDTFEASYMSMNDVTQNMLMYGIMIEKVYSEYNNS